MKKISTSQLVPGMVVGEDVLSFDRRTVLSKGTVLTDTLITRIELYGVLNIYIEDSAPEEPAAPESKPAAPAVPAQGQELSYFERVQSSPIFQEFKANYDQKTADLSFKISDMVNKNVPVDPQLLLEAPLELISVAGSRIAVLDMLHVMRGYDDETFAHCMNVSLLNYVLSSWLRWSDEDQKMAMLCGLFFDIGKLKVNQEILHSEKPLSGEDLQEVRRHAVMGYQILKDKGVDDHILNTAIMHHERYDGSGYPLKLHADKIDRFAALTAITDVYDAITSPRKYRKALCPFRAIEIFEEEGLEKYDSDMILTFLKNVGNTYVQNRCQLNDGSVGTIVMLNPERISRPVVLTNNGFLDLMKSDALRIERLL